jgi:hypothetical protein
LLESLGDVIVVLRYLTIPLEMMDPLRHPDLIEISRRLRLQLAQVLEAEQEAAAITMQRRSTIRDRLLDAEDRGEAVRIICTDGTTRTGMVSAVGIDHVVLEMSGSAVYVGLPHILAIEVATR